MKLAPYALPNARIKAVMGIDVHFAPRTRVLYVGPLECARHSFASMADDPLASFLIVDDVRTALGSTEDLVAQAAAELLEQHPETRGIVLATACQTPFLGIDLDQLCEQLRARFNCGFCHFQANRMSAANTPGPTRKATEGFDRYHTRRAVLSMLPSTPCPTSGLALLGTHDLGACELLQQASALGLDWVRSAGSLATPEQFEELRGARLNVVTEATWLEAGRYLQERFGTPYLYTPTGYSLTETDGYYAQIAETLGHQPQVSEARERAAAVIEETLQLVGSEPLELNTTYISRPWSLMEALLEYGFHLGAWGFDMIRVRHIDGADKPAFQRLKLQHPELVERSYVLQKRGRRDASVTCSSNQRPMGKYDEQGRPQGFGSKAREHINPEQDIELQELAEAGHGLVLPQSGKDAWAPVPAAYGEKSVWGYQAITALMEQIQAAFLRAALSPEGSLR